MSRSVIPLVLFLAAILLPGPAVHAGPNADATLVLHALVQGGIPPCATADPCAPGPPLTSVPAGEPVVAYLVLRNHDNVATLQTAFEWEGWLFNMGLWTCQSGQTLARIPANPGGPTHGTLTTSFDCISGGASAVIGRMLFATANGCLLQVPSAYPAGTHVVSCTGQIDQITETSRLGSICTSGPGVNACEPINNQAPVCDAGGAYTGNAGEPIILDGSGSSDPDGLIETYSWRFGDGSSGTGTMPQVVHVYSSAGSYTVTLCVTDDNGGQSCCDSGAEIGEPNAIGEEPAPAIAPGHIALSPGRPNPFSPSTAIEYELGEAGRIILQVYDASGRMIRTLVDAYVAAGHHAVEWNGSDDGGRPLGSGIYLCRLRVGSEVLTRKLVLME